ncbi:ubiquitin family domain-containing protein [Ditylenchus destructor]|uniref:Ubiquitin family domain-containing protein n=1 Tax=Ditylenchus destructor TaxID=166010 RepID=A0AAD4N5V2_9BILA|nr:ubiquitin family domain-containing protein [Ditylenchus destructor]
MSAQKPRCNRPVPPCNDRKTVDAMYANRTEASAIANSHLLNWLKSYGEHCSIIYNVEFDRIISPTDFLSKLENGLLLVYYAESISPGICPNIDPTDFSTEQCEKRIKAFIAFAKERARLADGCVFNVEDVYDKYEDSYQAVFYTIYKLGVQTSEKFGRHGIDICKMSDDTYQFLQKKAQYASKQEQLKTKSAEGILREGVIQISVIGQTGHELTYYVLATDSITELQERIEIDTALSPANQSLLYNGRRLFDSDRIMDCGISNGDTIELYIRQVGC